MGTVPSIHTIFLSSILLLMLLKPCFTVVLLAFPPPPSSQSREGTPPASAISLQIPNDSSAREKSYEHAISIQGLYWIEKSVFISYSHSFHDYLVILLSVVVRRDSHVLCMRTYEKSQACYLILDIVDQQIYAPINQTAREKKRDLVIKVNRSLQ